VKRVIATLVAGAILLACQAAVAVDATAAWNTYCGVYNFAPYPQSSATTFAQAYSGSNLSADFAAIKAAVSSSVQVANPGAGYDDLLNASLEDWR
jgi:hypothetical protein